MVVEDAGKEILGWTGERCAPVWDDSASTCSQCRAVLVRRHTHNCRLCGARFCSLCTAKYHVPPHLRRKAKAGPVRCCFACVAACFRRRDAALPSRSGGGRRRRRRAGLRVSVAADDGAVLIHPPVWTTAAGGSACCTCQRTASTHFCRTCGDVFCSDCSVKMDVPDAFRKKGKPNPVRVCCHCRFDIFGGAHLSETEPPPLTKTITTPLTATATATRHESTASAPDAGAAAAAVVVGRRHPPLRSASQGTASSSSGGGGGGVRLTSSMSSSPAAPLSFAVGQLRVSAAESISSRSSGSSSGSSSSSSGGLGGGGGGGGGGSGSWMSSGSAATSDSSGGSLRRVRVQWNDDDDEVVCVLEMPEDTPLHQVHRRLLLLQQQQQQQQGKALRDGEFAMECRGHEVPRVFWDIFTVRHLGDTLRLAPRRPPPPPPPPPPQPDDDQQPAAAAAHKVEEDGRRAHRSSSSSKVAAIGRVRALFSMKSDRHDFLSFDKGDELELLLKKPGSKWWYGRSRQHKGWIPSNFVEMIPDTFANESAA